jgi:hypothetical protein
MVNNESRYANEFGSSAHANEVIRLSAGSSAAGALNWVYFLP